MKLSFIICTRNSSQAIGRCLQSIAAAAANASEAEAEIIAVDNGSVDDTAAVLSHWAEASPIPFRALTEARPGRARAFNRALTVAAGDVIISIDDDCTVHGDYVRDLLRNYAEGPHLVVRGGAVMLGDLSDLPFTILTGGKRERWSRATNSARNENLLGRINGCNMSWSRALLDRIGLFDESFGPGSRVGSGDDADYVLRAYLAGAVIEYVPDMQVYHHHGRKTAASIRALYRRYMIGGGALAAKFFLKDPRLSLHCYWDLRNAIKELGARTNLFLPDIGFSYWDKVRYAGLGILIYLFWHHNAGAQKRWDEQRRLSVRPTPAR